jgi:purine-nucleoside phosphorylase
MGTIHIESVKEDIAEIVLMPGDPLRAKYIAENFLTNYKEVNHTRNMLAYTGYYNDKRVTVFPSGMGIPSMGIYAYELYKFYDVNKIIRIGTCGSNKIDIKVGDIILVDASYSESSFGEVIKPGTSKVIEASKDLTDKIYQTGINNNLNIKRGTVYTSDVFDVYFDISRITNNKDLLASEMEAYGLFFIANYLNKEAAAILTVVDSKYENEIISPENREKALNEMIKLALDSI